MTELSERDLENLVLLGHDWMLQALAAELLRRRRSLASPELIVELEGQLATLQHELDAARIENTHLKQRLERAIQMIGHLRRPPPG